RSEGGRRGRRSARRSRGGTRRRGAFGERQRRLAPARSGRHAQRPRRQAARVATVTVTSLKSQVASRRSGNETERPGHRRGDAVGGARRRAVVDQRSARRVEGGSAGRGRGGEESREDLEHAEPVGLLRSESAGG